MNNLDKLSCRDLLYSINESTTHLYRLSLHRFFNPSYLIYSNNENILIIDDLQYFNNIYAVYILSNTNIFMPLLRILEIIDNFLKSLVHERRYQPKLCQKLSDTKENNTSLSVPLSNTSSVSFIIYFLTKIKLLPSSFFL